MNFVSISIDNIIKLVVVVIIILEHHSSMADLCDRQTDRRII